MKKFRSLDIYWKQLLSNIQTWTKSSFVKIVIAIAIDLKWIIFANVKWLTKTMLTIIFHDFSFFLRVFFELILLELSFFLFFYCRYRYRYYCRCYYCRCYCCFFCWLDVFVVFAIFCFCTFEFSNYWNIRSFNVSILYNRKKYIIWFFW